MSGTVHVAAREVKTVTACGYPLVLAQAPANGLDRVALLFVPRIEHGWPALGWPVFRCRAGLMGADDLAGFRCSAEELAETLVEQVGLRDHPGEIVIFGNSSGGFPALLLGSMIASILPSRTVKVLAFSPIVMLWPRNPARRWGYSGALNAARSNPASSARLERYGDARPWIKEACRSAKLRVSVFYGARNDTDSREAAQLAGIPCVKLISVPTAQHNTLYCLRVPARSREMLETRLMRRAEREHPLMSDAERSEKVQSALEDLWPFRRNFRSLEHAVGAL